MEVEKLMSREDVLAVLRDVQFRPSCVDMGWEWIVEAVYYLDEEVPRGWLVATTFMRPDTETGVVGKGTGRQWFVERGASTYDPGARADGGVHVQERADLRPAPHGAGPLARVPEQEGEGVMVATKRTIVGEHVHAGIDEAAARGRMVLVPSEEELAQGQTNRIQRRAWKKLQKGKVRK